MFFGSPVFQNLVIFIQYFWHGSSGKKMLDVHEFMHVLLHRPYLCVLVKPRWNTFRKPNRNVLVYHTTTILEYQINVSIIFWGTCPQLETFHRGLEKHL